MASAGGDSNNNVGGVGNGGRPGGAGGAGQQAGQPQQQRIQVNIPIQNLHAGRGVAIRLVPQQVGVQLAQSILQASNYHSSFIYLSERSVKLLVCLIILQV